MWSTSLKFLSIAKSDGGNPHCAGVTGTGVFLSVEQRCCYFQDIDRKMYACILVSSGELSNVLCLIKKRGLSCCVWFLWSV